LIRHCPIRAIELFAGIMEDIEVASGDHAGIALSLQGDVDFSSMFGVSRKICMKT
jgi:hypothetical protein